MQLGLIMFQKSGLSTNYLVIWVGRDCLCTFEWRNYTEGNRFEVQRGSESSSPSFFGWSSCNFDVTQKIGNRRLHGCFRELGDWIFIISLKTTSRTSHSMRVAHLMSLVLWCCISSLLVRFIHLLNIYLFMYIDMRVHIAHFTALHRYTGSYKHIIPPIFPSWFSGFVASSLSDSKWSPIVRTSKVKNSNLLP